MGGRGKALAVVIHEVAANVSSSARGTGVPADSHAAHYIPFIFHSAQFQPINYSFPSPVSSLSTSFAPFPRLVLGWFPPTTCRSSVLFCSSNEASVSSRYYIQLLNLPLFYSTVCIVSPLTFLFNCLHSKSIKSFLFLFEVFLVYKSCIFICVVLYIDQY